MELTIKIDDPEFEKDIVGGVTKLKDEQLTEIVCKCIEKFLSNDNNLQKLIMVKPYYSDRYEPTEWIKNIFATYDGDNEAINQLRANIIKYLNDNYESLVFKALVAAISKQLLSNDLTVAFSEQVGRLDNITTIVNNMNQR